MIFVFVLSVSIHFLIYIILRYITRIFTRILNKCKEGAHNYDIHIGHAFHILHKVYAVKYSIKVVCGSGKNNLAP